MKKLSLKNLKIDSNDLLPREQLKSVTGGGYCSNVAADTVASMEAEYGCYTSSQYNAIYTAVYDYCVNY